MSTAPLARWSLQDAKARFSELVRRALASGPQLVTRGKEDAVVVIAAREYERLTAPRESFAEFLAKSPLRNVTLDLRRPRDTGRDVDL